MNFKKVLSIASVASIAVVGLVSCGKDKDKTENVSEYTGTINLALNYKNQGYLTYGRGDNSKAPDTYQTVDGKTLQKGQSVAAIWQDIATNMNCSFADAALAGADTKTSMINAINAKYVGTANKNIDMLQITTANEFNSAVNNGDFINLSAYKDQLPNLWAWLDAHAGVRDQMIQGTGNNKGIYYTPYFDGVDQVEKGFSMNAQIVRSLLDNDKSDATKDFNKIDGYDTAYTVDVHYTVPYITDMNNQEIAVAKKNADGTYGASKINVTITEESNVITKQNALAVKNGENLVSTLKQYLIDTYGNYISKSAGGRATGDAVVYEKLSDIFVSTSACYNADELIALLRCVKANPQKLTGSASAVMIPVFPRTAEANRASIFFEMAQMFGLRGTNGEKARFWINKDGQLVDTETQEYALDCLDLMHALQEEKLFPETANWMRDGADPKGDYRANEMKDGTCFMTYDYLNVAAYNKDADPNQKTAEMQGVLPPVAKWPFTTDNSGKTIVGATDKGYSYTRFTEDNRSLKDGGWSIVAKNVTDKSKLYKCLQIIDYLYTEEGSMLECYSYNMKDKNGTGSGDNFSNAVATGVARVGGQYYPVLTKEFKDAQKAATKGTWHNYMTMYLGSCLGVGNIRSNFLESQLTGSYQKVGTEKYENGLATGAMYLAQTQGTNFLRSVPTTIAYASAQQTSIDTNSKTLSSWWEITKTKNLWTSSMLNVVYSGWETAGALTSKALVKAQYNNYNSSTLRFTAVQWGLENSYGDDQYGYLSDFRTKINTAYHA